MSTSPGATSEQLIGVLLRAVEEELEGAHLLREDLHRRAELSHYELATAAAVQTYLGLETKKLDGAGFFTAIGPSEAPAVVVRAELDALPIREETGAPFACVTGAMHACGHDVHMAALAALLRAAKRIEANLPARLVGLFQPSEEAYPSGAEAVINRAADLPDVEAITAVHLHPEVPWNAAAADEGAINAAADNVQILIRGTAGHAGYPHRTLDPVAALASVLVTLQHALSRRLDPVQSATLAFTILRAGEAENVIPSVAQARGTLRTLQEPARPELRTTIVEIASDVAHAHGCEAEVAFIEGEPAVVNDERLALSTRTSLEAAGFRLAAPFRSCGADDFGYYRALAPSMLVFVGLRGAPDFEHVPLHHPRFLPPSAALEAVARAQAATFIAAARSH